MRSLPLFLPNYSRKTNHDRMLQNRERRHDFCARSQRGLSKSRKPDRQTPMEIHRVERSVGLDRSGEDTPDTDDERCQRFHPLRRQIEERNRGEEEHVFDRYVCRIISSSFRTKAFLLRSMFW